MQPATGYAGDISPEQAWAWVQSGEAELVDVRTDAERAWVGFVPGAHALAWKQWPGMAMNPGFDAGVQALGGPNAAHIFGAQHLAFLNVFGHEERTGKGAVFALNGKRGFAFAHHGFGLTYLRHQGCEFVGF